MILLTGATGFTGGHILDLLLERGYKVTCFVRSTSNIEKLKYKSVTIKYGDLDDYKSIVAALSGVDILINVASLGFGHAPNIVNACLESGIKRAIFFSTTGIFTNLNPGSKKIRLEAEEIIRKSGLDYTILRPTMIYGTHEDRNMCRLISFIKKHKVIPILGDGTYLQQPVYVKDLAMSVVLALENPISIKKEYNVPGGKELTYNQVIEITSKLLGRNIVKIHLPLSLCIIILKAYEKISKNPILKVEQALRLNENKSFSIQQIQADLGYTALSFNEGIKLEIEEMREKNII